MRAALLGVWLVVAGAAAAQNTPATPGVDGAVAAGEAYVGALASRDWVQVLGHFEAVGLDSLAADAQRAVRAAGESDPAAESVREAIGGATTPVEVVAGVLSVFAQDAGGGDPGPPADVLGAVAESDTLVHVVVRDGVALNESLDPSASRTIRARWTGTRWVIVGGRFQALLDGLRVAFRSAG